MGNGHSNEVKSKGIQYINKEFNNVDLSDKIYCITGANSGIGLEATRILNHLGATVILACRNPKKVEKAIDDLVNGVTEVKKVTSPFKCNKDKLIYMNLDLSDIDSCKSFAKELNEKYGNDGIDAMIGNAGVMALNTREVSKQGNEMQMAVNVIGHYVVYCLTYELVAKRNGRIVSVSSGAHRMTKTIDIDNFDCSKSYKKWNRYSETKLGNLVTMVKLNEIFEEKNIPVTIVGCHPGYSATSLQDDTIFESLNAWMAQSSLFGSLPTVYATLNDDMKANTYIGPNGWFQMSGYPKKERPNKPVFDKELQNNLYNKLKEITEVEI